MNHYKVKFSYMENGRRVHDVVFCVESYAADAADRVRENYKDLEGLRIENVWIETETTWDAREFDY